MQCLPWELSDAFSSDLDTLEDLLVPQQGSEGLFLAREDSLNSTDLFLPAFESSEATSSFSSGGSDVSSRLADPAVDFPLLFDEPEHGVQQVPAAAPLPLGPTGLRLQLDCGAVMAAWQAQAQVHPFQLRGPALQAAVAALPSTADLEASLATASQQCSMGPAQPPSAAALAAAEARRKLEAQRQRDRKAAARKSDRKVVYPARKASADKRPRIKGRFVTKAEYEQMLNQIAAEAEAEEACVPAC